MPADSLSTTFAALADPTRRAILARLASGECSVTELAEPFDDEPAGGLEAPPGARAGRPDRARPGRPVAALPHRGGAHSRRSPTGPSATATSGKGGSIASTRTCRQASRRRRRSMLAKRAANSDTFKVTTPSDRRSLTRLFDAPRELVFEAMTKPEHVKQLVGPPRRAATRCRSARSTCASAARGASSTATRRARSAFYGEYREIDAARPARLHRDLRAVPRRRLGGDAPCSPTRAARRGSPSPCATPRSRCATWCSAPGWRRAPRSATTASRIWSDAAALNLSAAIAGISIMR